METVEVLGQEWCIIEKNFGYYEMDYPTLSTGVATLVLCNKEKWFKNSGEGMGSSGIRYRPLRFEDLKIAEI